MNDASTSPVFDFKSAEFVLLAGGAALTVVVFVIAIILFRMASREHRKQVEREQREFAAGPTQKEREG